jgi:tRNA threonylcarbamoyladenosine biosynthesis protein TsaB
MGLILLIDTALEVASVGIAREGSLLCKRENAKQNDHAAWLHVAIQEVLTEAEIDIHQLDAVGITDGPGSYTGLRVGMAAAKGICYAQNIPLISVSTLRLLATSVQDEEADLIIALIDARRDEVYAGAYDRAGNVMLPEQAMMLTPESFQDICKGKKVVLTGNGASKTIEKLTNKDLFLSDPKHAVKNLAEITYKKFINSDFSDLAYHEPAYLKDFYTTAKVNQ